VKIEQSASKNPNKQLMSNGKSHGTRSSLVQFVRIWSCSLSNCLLASQILGSKMQKKLDLIVPCV
jgi:hypothetical protein